MWANSRVQGGREQAIGVVWTIVGRGDVNFVAIVRVANSGAEDPEVPAAREDGSARCRERGAEHVSVTPLNCGAWVQGTDSMAPCDGGDPDGTMREDVEAARVDMPELDLDDGPMNWIPTVVALVVVVFFAVRLVQQFKLDAQNQAVVNEQMGTYTAVIQDIIHMKGQYDRTKLFLRIETPDGPIGEYLIVPLTSEVSMAFLQDARVTQRPIRVECCVDRSIEYAYRQHATVLGLA